MKKRTNWNYVLFAIVYFVQGALGLTNVALPIFLRDLLGLSIPEIATLSAIAGVPWTIKPVYGILSDYYPLKGLRRKPYLYLFSVLAALGWLLTAINGSYWTVLFAQVCAALGVAATDAVADGLAVQKSTPKIKGRIQAVCWGSRSVGAVIAAFLGGWLLSFVSGRVIFASAAALPLLTIVAASFVRERPVKAVGDWKRKLAHAVSRYKKTPTLWWVMLFLFVWYASPSFSTPLFFYVKDTLGLSTTFLGLLGSMANLGGILGAFLFWHWLDKVSQKKLFTCLIFLSAALSLLFYVVLGGISALFVYFLNGAFGIIVTVAAMRLIVEVCPSGVEATTFALVTSVTNFSSGVFAQYVGGQLFALIGYKPLILVNAAVGLLPLLLVKPIFRRLG